MTSEAVAMEGAIDWHVRGRDLDAAGWERFVDWLEADPAHARAYDALALLDRALPVPALPVAANDDVPVFRRRLGWGAGAAALAACLALVVGLATRPAAPGGFTVTTQPGETREVALADGTRVAVAGGSRIAFADRSARVEAGEAMFRVRHDAAHPFTVSGGGLTLQDVGTAFDVALDGARDGDRLEVKVADGAVMVQPAAERLLLTRGQAAVASGGSLTRRAIDPADADGWARGQLRFDGVPLAAVAAAVHRQTGAALVLEGDLPARDFTGMIRLSGVAARDVPHVAAMIGTTWRRRGDQWVLGPEGAR